MFSFRNAPSQVLSQLIFQGNTTPLPITELPLSHITLWMTGFTSYTLFNRRIAGC